MRLTLRSGVVRLHRWFGLTVGLLVVFLALTGGWIVLRPVLDPVVYPELMIIPSCTKPLPIDTLAAVAREFHPGPKLEFVYLYGTPTASTMLRFSDTDQVYVDGCSGEVLGDQRRYSGLYGTVEALHRFRFLKTSTAMLIIGTTAILLAFILVAGGVFIWWPRRKSAWKRTLTIDPRSKGRAYALSLHSTLGVYAGAVIFIVALTAIPLSFAWAKSALFVATRTTDMTEDAPPVHATPQKPAASTPPLPRISMQAAWLEARSLIGGPLVWASLHAPGGSEPIEIGMVQKAGPHAEARSYVYIDPQTGKVVAFRPYATLGAGSKLYYWALAIHTGHAGGILVQLLMVFAMLCVTAIGYTGVESFVRRKLRRSSR